MSSLLPDPGASLLDRIKTSMVGLKMPRAIEIVDACVGRLDHGEITALEAIEQLLLEELTFRENRRIKTALVMGRLGSIKTLAGYDFSFQDAQVLLHMLRIGATQRYVDPLAAGINDLQELSKTDETISRMKTQTWHRILTYYLPLYFPEIARFAGNSRSDRFLALIERFPTPATITALDREAFSAAAWQLIGRKVSKARLINDIYETASASTALPVPKDSAAITMFRMVIAQGRNLIHQRDEIKQLAHARLADHIDYHLLRNIPGIGPINALTILAEAGDLRRFGHHRQFLKFCGLDLATCQSGTFRGRTKLSRYGNARLRRTCWMAPQVVIGARVLMARLRPRRRLTRRFSSRYSRSSFLWFMTSPSRANMIPSRR